MFRQDEPWSRHVVKEQGLLRGMDAPPARGSENLGSLWQSSSRPLHLRRQLSLPNLFHKEHGCPGPVFRFMLSLKSLCNRRYSGKSGSNATNSFQYAVSCTPQSLLSKKSEMQWRSRLYSQTPRPFWWAMAGCIAIGSHAIAKPLVRFLVLHEPMDVQFHCVLIKRLQLKRKKNVFPIQASSTQYSSTFLNITFQKTFSIKI